jgi:hypothetical protein
MSSMIVAPQPIAVEAGPQVRGKHPVRRLPQSHGGLALVHAIAIDPRTGDLSGGADTGSGGMALQV